MNKKLCVTFIAIMCLAFAVNAFAGGAPSQSSSMSGAVYNHGATALSTTEGFVSGCLRNIFGAFNPCLDMVRGCSDVVFSPLDKGVGYVENKVRGTRYVKRRVKVSSDKDDKGAEDSKGKETKPDKPAPKEGGDSDEKK